MRPYVKICGVTNLEDALFAAQAGADALGFNFFRQSPRFVEPSVAARIIAELPGYVAPIGIFVNESLPTIERIAAETGIRIVQLSGDESPDDCRLIHFKVWKTFRIRDPDDITQVTHYPIAAALLDGASDQEYGGSGRLPDFSIACQLKEYHQVVLAGGLSPENVIQAIDAVDPFGIDVNSGVEVSPGKKDHDKIMLLFDRLARLR